MEGYKGLLKDLQNAIWEEKPVATRRFGRPTTGKIMELRRKLSACEWGTLKTVLQVEEVVCQMENSRFGFGLALIVFEPPVCPGAPPVCLFFMEDDHLPRDDKEGTAAERWDAAWDAFCELTLSERNIALAEFSGFPPQKSKVHYEY